MSDTQVQAGGIGFLPLLTLVFITLKLCGVINWSWWWVLSPTLIPLGIILVLLVVCAITVGLAEITKK